MQRARAFLNAALLRIFARFVSLSTLVPISPPAMQTGLLIPSLKSDPRRRHGLLFTNENCKYERTVRVSTRNHSRGRGQLIIASELIKSGKHANALFIFQSDEVDRVQRRIVERVGEAFGAGKSEELAQGIRIIHHP